MRNEGTVEFCIFEGEFDGEWVEIDFTEDWNGAVEIEEIRFRELPLAFPDSAITQTFYDQAIETVLVAVEDY
ncbi:MAG: hypothetical protein CMO55_12235 [Verrucomicrobiales bacterium]|nr:hypothetical protein [Verrucomicrobiales bacterium]